MMQSMVIRMNDRQLTDPGTTAGLIGRDRGGGFCGGRRGRRSSVAFQVIHVEGVFNPSDPTFLVIRDPKQWVKFRSASQIKGPDIDFNRFTLVIAATGQKGSSGFSVVVSSVEDAPIETTEQVGRVTQVSILDVGPGSCPRLTEMARAVAVFALIAKKDQRVRFSIRKVGFDCTVFPQVNAVNEAVAAGTASRSHQ
jgi:hypothetical protein